MLVWGGSQRDPVRIVAVVLGFLGVLGVLRPSIERDQWIAALVGLGAAATAAIAMMQIRQLGREGEAEWRTVLLFSTGACLSGAVGLGVLGWQAVNLRTVLALLGLGLCGMIAQLAMTRAFGLGSTLLTAALQYTTIIFAALLGVVFWGDRPAALAWAGMALIICSGLLSVWRTYTESRIMRGEQPSRAQPGTTQEARVP